MRYKVCFGDAFVYRTYSIIGGRYFVVVCRHPNIHKNSKTLEVDDYSWLEMMVIMKPNYALEAENVGLK